MVLEVLYELPVAGWSVQETEDEQEQGDNGENRQQDENHLLGSMQKMQGRLFPTRRSHREIRPTMPGCSTEYPF
jgi:hypothetical protein